MNRANTEGFVRQQISEAQKLSPLASMAMELVSSDTQPALSGDKLGEDRFKTIFGDDAALRFSSNNPCPPFALSAKCLILFQRFQGYYIGFRSSCETLECSILFVLDTRQYQRQPATTKVIAQTVSGSLSPQNTLLLRQLGSIVLARFSSLCLLVLVREEIVMRYRRSSSYSSSTGNDPKVQQVGQHGVKAIDTINTIRAAYHFRVI